MEVFHCYEFLLMKKFQEDSVLWDELKSETWVNLKTFLGAFQDRILKSKIDGGDGSENDIDVSRYKKISADLWFLAVTLEKSPHRLLAFLNSELRQESENVVQIPGQTVLARYLSHYNFVEMHLDSIFKYGETATLPKELFRCRNVRVLSLKYNNLEWIPPDVGRLSCLERLSLTNNRLQNKSIPHTLTFCHCLKELYLDNNLLDALPGFLLDMPQLCTVHRHGNHNYFKATFMWYHTDVNDRVLHVFDEVQKRRKPSRGYNPESLLFLAATALISSNINFFEPGLLPNTLQEYMSDIYPNFSICDNCNSAVPYSSSGYRVFTFKNPYLGNTCVPFQHWACSRSCAEAIEIPAHQEQMRAAERMDEEYDHYIQEIQNEEMTLPSRGFCVLL
ncbi:leucine-rich repeat-containing protein 58-like [Periplaneta americana]|uniref:leucine-rich repeat-containing protein 58-like n=1 Tax=Periplaneta americana TaxID=6978 RepID=UPI0037E9474E